MPGQLSSHLSMVLTAAAAVQTFGTAVAYTPDIDLKVIFNDPDVRKTLEEVLAAKDSGGDAEKAMREAMEKITQLGKHLGLAKIAVGDWKEEVLPLAFTIASSVRGYNAEVQSVTSSINTQLAGLAGLTTDQLKSVVASVKAEIDTLQKALATRATSVEHLQAALTAFSSRLQSLSGDFKDDYEHVRSLLVAEGGVIDDIRSQIGDLNRAVTKDIVGIGAGALVGGIGIGLVVGGIVVLAATGGTAAVAGIALIAVGVAAIIAGGIAGGLGLADLPKVREKVEELTRDLSVIEQVMAFFGAIDTHLDSISEAAATGADSAIRLKGYYDTVLADLTAMAEPLDGAERVLNAASADPAATLTAVTASFNTVLAELGTVATDWADAAADAELLQNALEGITQNVTNTLPSTPEVTP